MSRVVSYTIGLILALALTAAAFSLVIGHVYGAGDILPIAWLIPAVLALAMVQLAVQLIFFLHLGQGKDSQWNTAAFCFTFFGILTIIVASIWIMDHLNYNMTPQQMQQYISDQSSF